MAEILKDQHRFSEAEQRYEEALDVARRAGDGGLEGAILQHLGILASRQGQHALAVTRYKEALARFQEAEDRASEMRTADVLGSAEEDLGHHESARAWYVEAERLARALAATGPFILDVLIDADQVAPTNGRNEGLRVAKAARREEGLSFPVIAAN